MLPLLLIGIGAAGLATGKLSYNLGKRHGQKCQAKITELVMQAKNSPYFKNKEEAAITTSSINKVGLKNIQAMINMLISGAGTWLEYDRKEFERYYYQLINKQ